MKKETFKTVRSVGTVASAYGAYKLVMDAIEPVYKAQGGGLFKGLGAIGLGVA